MNKKIHYSVSSRTLLAGLLFFSAGSYYACDYCGGDAAIRPLPAGGLWSSPATWPNGTIPGPGAQIMIPENTTVILDTATPALKSLKISGILKTSPLHDTALSADWVMIDGPGARLEAGSSLQPTDRLFTLTLTGSDPTINVTGTAPMNTGTKFLIAMNGGSLELHGQTAKKRPFSVLNGSLAAGATSLTLAHEPTNWAIGDRLGLAPSGFSALEAEVVTITAIQDKTISFSPALRYPHFGELQTIDNTIVDQRAEVGNLSHNIVIQGDASSTANGFGGHVMIMAGGTAHVEGVRFQRMGQRGLRGRYAFHWHFLDRSPYAQAGVSGRGQWIRHCSFEDIFQRAVNIHGTDHTHITGNVVYNVENHAFVLAEDGDETDNIAAGNLAILVRHPLNDKYAFFSGNFQQPAHDSLQNEDDSSGFWMVNPNQKIINNHIAGVELGNGIAIDSQHEGTPLTLTARQSLTERVLIAHNVLHTIQGREAFNAHMYHNFAGFGVLTTEQFEFNNGYTHILGNTIYKAMNGGGWLDGEDWLDHNILADNGSATHSIHSSMTRNLVVGYTANRRGLNQQDDGPSLRSAFGYEMSRDRNHWTPQTIGKNRFIGLTGPGLRIVDGTTWSDGAQAYGNSFTNHTGPRYHRDAINLNPGYGALLDRDGHLGQTQQPTFLTMSSLNATSTQRTEMDSYLTPALGLTSSYYFRGWFNSVNDGDVISPGAVLPINVINPHSDSSLRKFRVSINDQTTVIPISATATTVNYTVPAQVTPGYKKVYLSNHTRSVQRLFAFVGTTATPRHFTDWAAMNDLSALPPIERSATADPDTDGVSNFEEFVFGTDPRVKNSPRTIKANFTPASGSTLVDFSYRRSQITQDVSYDLEASTDLQHWTPLTATAVTEMGRIDHGDLSETVSVQANLTASPSQRQFIRLCARGPGY
jgi:hypothetical protein